MPVTLIFRKKVSIPKFNKGFDNLFEKTILLIFKKMKVSK
jgi:hypothetical protein